MEKFINNKKLKTVLLALTLFLILLKIVFYICNEKYHLYILISNINQYTVNLTINILIVLAALFLLNINAKRVRTYVQSGCACLIILIFIYLHLFDGDKFYFYFQSPDKTKTLVVEECSWLLSGWSNFYVKRGIFIEKLGAHITTDDGFRPFTFNSYDLKWLDENTIELTYNYGSGDRNSPVYKTSIIHVK